MALIEGQYHSSKHAEPAVSIIVPNLNSLNSLKANASQHERPEAVSEAAAIFFH